ncbi:hypothetical protein FE257_005064 [Aspergillus nanangensis]|uniref:Heterokaryon incompatibility domain-containing protein n=1 Tax=Aspergillus nanangensis TaxID=2582783 RepID=A0AAD4CRK4_ASPNN|nr:hypothetical protein FE257_005064 [Aspergillus nanangensis]
MRVSSVNLQFFVDKSSKCSWLPLQSCPKLALSTDSPETFSRLRRWLETCRTEHGSCGAGSYSALPTRVVDLGEGADEKDDVRLCEGDQVAQYAAVSHCWGSRIPITTTTANLDAHKQNISFSDLPKTFQDVVAICRRLQIRYLWIDSLCIIQDDEEDWQIESSRMASIYEGSTLTIAASAAQDSSEGCFMSVPTGRTTHTLTWPGSSTTPAYSVYVRRAYPHAQFWDEYKETQREAPLLDRAWFYQERFLSPRVVHFSKCELWWECQQISTCECKDSIPSMAPPDHIPMEVRNRNQLKAHDGQLSASPEDENSISDPWQLGVRAYSKLALTFPRDVFPALSGLATRVQESKPGLTYYAGLWLSVETNKLSDLVWINDGYPKARPRRWRAPSWSWASVSEILPRWMYLNPDHIYAKLVEVKLKPFGVDGKGELRDAYITVSGPVIRGVIGAPTVQVTDRQNVLHPRGAEVWIRGEPNPRSGLRPLVRLDLNPKLCKPPIVSGEAVYCLRLGRGGFDQDAKSEERDISLCLRVVDMENGQPVFERIGLVAHDYVLEDPTRQRQFNMKIV